MDSYGEILKRAREQKGLDVEGVARETSITQQYIEGIESEDNSAFPGEAYMLGFMRNYAEYLGVNPDTVCNLYRAKKLQESPVPEGLIVREKPKYFWPLIISGISLFVITVVVVICIIASSKKKVDDTEVVVDKNSSVKKYELSDKALTQRLYVGDQVIFPTEEGSIILSVSDTLASFGILTPVGTLYTDLAEENPIDIDGDNVADLIVYVSDISASDASRGAEVRIVKRSSGTYISSSVSTEDIPFASEISSTHKQVVILEDNRAYPFTLNGSFRGNCEFRYKVDRHASNESYFASGEVVTMTANNSIRLWMSNCNTVKFSITADAKNYDLEIGKAGQVLVEDIKWIKDTDGRYKLVVIELD